MLVVTGARDILIVNLNHEFFRPACTLASSLRVHNAEIRSEFIRFDFTKANVKKDETRNAWQSL